MMSNSVFKKLQQLAVVLVGASVVSGCPSPTASNLLASSGLDSQETAREVVALSESAGVESAMDFEVCAEVENWQRPTEGEQSKRLSADPRYGEALASGSLKSASTQFWNHQVISFTTYGLSARLEPENLSGVWTATEAMSACYVPETMAAINGGDRAETWLLNHDITGLEKVGDRYTMTVEPSPTGLQVIQFDRTDEQATLPLDVVTTSGTPVEVVSGDWQ